MELQVNTNGAAISINFSQLASHCWSIIVILIKKTNEGKTALDIAKEINSPRIVQALENSIKKWIF